MQLMGFFFLLGAWLVPLHFPPWVSWHGELLAFLSIAALTLSVVIRRHRAGETYVLQLPGAAIPLLGLAIVVFIQSAAGLITYAGDAIILVLYLVMSVAAISTGFGSPLVRQITHEGVAVRGTDHLQSVAWTLLVGATISTFVALQQVFELGESAIWVLRMADPRRPGGNLGQPNQLGTLLLMGIASLVYLWELRKLSLLPCIATFTILIVGVSATESRTAVLSFVTLSAWCIVGRRREAIRVSLGAAASAAIAFLILFFSWPHFMAFGQNFPSGARSDLTAGMRLVVWPQLLEAISSRPWLGWGLGETSKAHNAVVSNYAISEPFTYSHNLGLDLILGLGVPLGFGLLLLVAVFALRHAYGALSLQAWYCIAAVMPVAVHSMLEFPFAYSYFLFPSMLLVGALSASAGAKPCLNLGLKTVSVALLVVSSVGAWCVNEYINVEEDFRIARFEALRIGTTDPEYKVPEIRLLTQLRALLSGARLVPKTGMSEEEIQHAGDVALRFPWPATLNRYALSLALNGHPMEARRQLQVLKALHGERVFSEIEEKWKALATQENLSIDKLLRP